MLGVLCKFTAKQKIHMKSHEILCQAEDSHEISSLIFSENNEEVFMNAVCCSRDWRLRVNLTLLTLTPEK